MELDLNIFLKQPKFEEGRVLSAAKGVLLKKRQAPTSMVRVMRAEPGVGQYDQPTYKVIVVGPAGDRLIGRAFMIPETYLSELPPLIELAFVANDARI